MSKFKVGDVAVANQTDRGNNITMGKEYPVIGVRAAFHSPSNMVIIIDDRGTQCGVLDLRFNLKRDELPPAPESVQYNAGTGDGCVLDSTILPENKWADARIRIGVTPNRGGVGKCTMLTPDEALQLCHDLRRMAMSIKRKEKQHG